MTDRLMIDIETIGTEPGAVIASIGAVQFSIEDGIKSEFFVSVDIEDCQRHGLEIDAETMLWWMGQDAEAQEQLHGGVALKGGLEQLSEFVPEDAEVWANSPAFDCIMLERAYDAVGMEAPWQFYQYRDYRTVRELDAVPWVVAEQDGTEHNALDDARHQAQCLIDALSQERSDAR